MLLAPERDAETVSAFFEDMCSPWLVVSDGALEIIDTGLRCVQPIAARYRRTILAHDNPTGLGLDLMPQCA